MDPVRLGGRFETGGHVDRVAPDVIGELRRADHPGDGRPAVEADPDLPLGSPSCLDLLDHLEGRLGDRRRVVGPAIETADDQVCVADRLDLLDAGPLADLVEAGEEHVELLDQVRWCEASGDPGEPDDVAEQDADRLVTIRDQRLAGRQPVDDPLGQHVEQETLGACAFHLELGEQPRLERRVRILERLEPADVGLEPLETPGEPAVLLVELVGRGLAGRLVRQAGPVPSADVEPRRTDTIVALWNRVRSADASGAISPWQ